MVFGRGLSARAAQTTAVPHLHSSHGGYRYRGILVLLVTCAVLRVVSTALLNYKRNRFETPYWNRTIHFSLFSPDRQKSGMAFNHSMRLLKGCIVLAGLAGFEPTWYGLEIRCIIRSATNPSDDCENCLWRAFMTVVSPCFGLGIAHLVMSLMHEPPRYLTDSRQTQDAFTFRSRSNLSWDKEIFGCGDWTRTSSCFRH